MTRSIYGRRTPRPPETIPAWAAAAGPDERYAGEAPKGWTKSLGPACGPGHALLWDCKRAGLDSGNGATVRRIISYSIPSGKHGVSIMLLGQYAVVSTLKGSLVCQPTYNVSQPTLPRAHPHTRARDECPQSRRSHLKTQPSVTTHTSPT